MMMIQLALNVFGSLDIPAVTGVSLFPLSHWAGRALYPVGLCWPTSSDGHPQELELCRALAEKMRDRNEFTRWDEDDGQELDMESPFVQDSREVILPAWAGTSLTGAV